MTIPRETSTLDGPAWTGVRVLVTTRAGGVSAPPYASFNLGGHVGDDPAAVAENRRRLIASVPGPVHWLDQVHGTQVHLADPASVADTPPRADAAVTTHAGTVLAVMTADCLPVVIADTRARAVAVAHAGWRGLAGGVLESTLVALQTAVPDGRWRAWIGPAIGPSAFEVGPDVLAAFPGAGAAFTPRDDVPGKWWCDLPALAVARLQAAGVADVTCSGLCTVTDSRFYSYRRDALTGRFATLAWLESAAGQGGAIP